MEKRTVETFIGSNGEDAKFMLNFDNLKKKISKMTNVDIEALTVEVKKDDRGKFSLMVESQNVIGMCGLMKVAFSGAYIVSHASNVSVSGDMLTAFVDLYLGYQEHCGNGDSSEIGSAFFNGTEWTLSDATGRQVLI